MVRTQRTGLAMICARVPAVLAHKLRLFAIKNHRTVQEVITTAVEKEMKR